MAALVNGTPVSGLLDRSNFLPTAIIEQNLISPNSSAYTCFTKQKFSGQLQAYLINYVISVSGYQAIYK